MAKMGDGCSHFCCQQAFGTIYLGAKTACDLVGGTRFELVASSVSGKRSPTELTARGGSGNRTRVQGFAGPCLSHSAIPP